MEIDGILLPNIDPEAPLDYILIGMELSLVNWARDRDRDKDPEWRRVSPKEKIDQGFRNFCGVWILHRPVRKFLWRKGET